jgi:hypothetical protein
LEFLMTVRHRPILVSNSTGIETQASPEAGDHDVEATSADVPQARRRFFKAALRAPALAVAATVAPRAVAAPVAVTPEAAPPRQSNYHETPHIRTYYDLAAY